MVSCFWSVKEKLHLNKAFKLLAVLLGSRWRGYYSWVMLNPANQTGCMSFRLRRTYWRVQVHWSAMLHWSVGMFYFFLLFPSGSVINLQGVEPVLFLYLLSLFPLHRSIRVVPAVSPANKQTVIFFPVCLAGKWLWFLMISREGHYIQPMSACSEHNTAHLNYSGIKGGVVWPKSYITAWVILVHIAI